MLDLPVFCGLGPLKKSTLRTIWGGSWVCSCNTYAQHLCSYFGCCLSVQASVSKLSDFVVYIGVCTACLLINSRLHPVIINIIFFSLEYEVFLACLFADWILHGCQPRDDFEVLEWWLYRSTSAVTLAAIWMYRRVVCLILLILSTSLLLPMVALSFSKLLTDRQASVCINVDDFFFWVCGIGYR